MVVEPKSNDTTGEVTAKTSFLSPHFEEGRVRMLGIPAEGELDIVVWEEHWNPYDTLREGLFEGKKGVKIMVDEEIRDYIVRGLTASGFDTIGLGGEVEAVRQIKSEAEVELLRAVNTGTVEALRTMRPCLVPGLTEDEVTTILDNSMLSIAFSLFFNIVLFEENGALPHGGFITGGKALKEDSMVLIDVGYALISVLNYSLFITDGFPEQRPLPRILLRRLPQLLHRPTSLQEVCPEQISFFIPPRNASDMQTRISELKTSRREAESVVDSTRSPDRVLQDAQTKQLCRQRGHCGQDRHRRCGVWEDVHASSRSWHWD